jgi:hypothetical protein
VGYAGATVDSPRHVVDYPGISPFWVAPRFLFRQSASNAGCAPPAEVRRGAARRTGVGTAGDLRKEGLSGTSARTRKGTGAGGKGCTRWWPATGVGPARDRRRYGGRAVRHGSVVGGHQASPEGLGGCG